jgi:hypothetical protein
MTKQPHRKRARRAAACAAIVAWLAIAAGAREAVPVYGAVPGGPSVVLSSVNGASPYSGVGRYEGRATCTAFFLATGPPGEDGRDAPAYALTSGAWEVSAPQLSPDGRSFWFLCNRDWPGDYEVCNVAADGGAVREAT